MQGIQPALGEPEIVCVGIAVGSRCSSTPSPGVDRAGSTIICALRSGQFPHLKKVERTTGVIYGPHGALSPALNIHNNTDQASMCTRSHEGAESG